MTGKHGFTLVKLLVFLIIFGAVLTVAWVYFLPTILTSALQKRTGFGVTVTELRFNPFNAKVDLSGLIITNPEGFPRQDFIEVRSFNANAKLKTLFSDRPVFDYAWVEVACVTFVRDAHGVINARVFRDRLNPLPSTAADENADGAKTTKEFKLDAMVSKGGPVDLSKVTKKPADKEAKDAKLAKEKNAAETKTNKDAVVENEQGKQDGAAEQPAVKTMQFLIKRLEIRLDKVVVADYAGPTPTVREFDRKFFYSYDNVTDPKQLLAPFALKSLEPVGAALKGLIPGDIGKAIGAATANADDEILKKSADSASDPIKTVVEKLEESQKP